MVSTIKAVSLVRGASRGKDEGQAYKWQHKAALTACYHLLSIAPCGLYINSVKEDDVTIATSSSKGIEISGGLGSKGEANSSKE